MSAEMNLRSERTDKILDLLEDRIRRLEKELARLRGGQYPSKNWKPFSKFTELKQGDIVRWRQVNELFRVVMLNDYNASVTRVLEVTNPHEWEVLR